MLFDAAGTAIIGSEYSGIKTGLAVKIYKILDNYLYKDIEVKLIRLLFDRETNDICGWMTIGHNSNGFAVQAEIQGFRWQVDLAHPTYYSTGVVYGYSDQRASIMIGIFERYVQEHVEHIRCEEFFWKEEQ